MTREGVTKSLHARNFGLISCFLSFRNIPAPIEITLALHPSKTPPVKNEELYGHGGVPALRWPDSRESIRRFAGIT